MEDATQLSVVTSSTEIRALLCYAAVRVDEDMCARAQARRRL